jgi:hypothetical protein
VRCALAIAGLGALEVHGCLQAAKVCLLDAVRLGHDAGGSMDGLPIEVPVSFGDVP